MSSIPYLRSVWWSQNFNGGAITVEADPVALGQKGQPNGIATLDGTGKIPTLQVPAIAITDTYVVASQVAMLALSAQTGDIAVRTDTNESYILQGSNPALLGDWQVLLPIVPSETDPIFVASAAYGIVAGDIVNWDAAFGWGDHSLAGYITALLDDTSPQLGAALDVNGFCIEGKDNATGPGGILCLVGGDSLDQSGPGGYISVRGGVGDGSAPALPAPPTNPVAADLWLVDIQATPGYVGFSAPDNVSAGSTGDGANTVWVLPEGDGVNGQVMITDGAGVLSWATPVAAETDPIFSASPAFGITGTQITNWDTWIASPAQGITGTQISNWDTAFGWGNHAIQGYLTSIPAGYVQTPMVEDLDVATWGIRGSDTTTAPAGGVTVRGGNATGDDGGAALFKGGSSTSGTIGDDGADAVLEGGDANAGNAADSIVRGGSSTAGLAGRAVLEGGAADTCQGPAGGVWIYDGKGDGTLPAIPAPVGAVEPMRALWVDAQVAPGYVGFKAPDSVVAGLTGDGLNTVWVLPEGDGTSGQALVTNGAGVLSWASAVVGAAALSSLTAAGAANTISNGAFQQRWNWTLALNTQRGMFFGEAAAGTNGTGDQDLVHIETFSEASTTDPIGIYQGGNQVFKVFGLTGETRIRAGDVSGTPGDLTLGTLNAAAGNNTGGDMSILLGNGFGQGAGGDFVGTAGNATDIDIDAAAAGDGGAWAFYTGNGANNASNVDGTPGDAGHFLFHTGDGGSITNVANAQNAADAGRFQIQLGRGGTVAGAGNAGEDGYVLLDPQAGSTSGARIQFNDAAGSGGMSLKAPDTVNAPGNRFELSPKFKTINTATDSVAENDDVVELDPVTAGAAMTVNLHSSANERFRELILKVITQSATNTITVTPAGVDTIDGAASLVIPINSQWNTYRLINKPGTTIWYVT